MSAFVLERFNWRRAESATWVRLPGETAVGTFDAAEDAQAEQGRREAEARAAVAHPFRCGTTLAEFTTLPEFAFLDWLSDAELDPPDHDPDGRIPWLAWADLFAGEWTASQLTHIWQGCNRVRFFRVRERINDPLSCVLRVHCWQDRSNSNHLLESEGGTPLALWHDRLAAEQDRVAKQELAAAEMAASLRMLDEPEIGFDPRFRAAASNPFGPTPKTQPTLNPLDVIHAELIEVDRGEPELGLPTEPLSDTAFMVLRVGWEPLMDDLVELPGLFDRPDEIGGMPVRVFARQDEAKSFRDQVETEYRSFANPYRFRPAAVREGTPDLSVRFAELGVGHLLPVREGQYQDYYALRQLWIHWWERVADGLTDQQRMGLWEITWDPTGPLVMYEVREIRVADAGHRPVRRVRTLYYVRATNWLPDGGPRRNPVRFLGAFADPARAEAVRDEAERTFRANPPFDQPPPVPCEPDQPWSWYSSMSTRDAMQHLVAHGLIEDGRDPSTVQTADWWHHSPLRPFQLRQVRAMWQLFDRVQLYEVLALPTEVVE